MTITITIPFPDRGRLTDLAPRVAGPTSLRRAHEPAGLRPALASLGWAVALEVAEDLVPGLGLAVALGRVARAACAVVEPGEGPRDGSADGEAVEDGKELAG